MHTQFPLFGKIFEVKIQCGWDYTVKLWVFGVMDIALM
jgi:hypothetical protein